MRTTDPQRPLHRTSKLALASLLGVAALPVQAIGQTCTPSFLGSYDTPGNAMALTAAGSTVYVADRKEGTTVYYSLETPCVLRLLGCVESVIEKSVKKQMEGLSQSAPTLSR